MVDLKDIGDFLAHPMVLLLTGAAVSNFLVPYLTRRWQDHKRTLEIKTALVIRISESVTAFLVVVQCTVWGSTSLTREQRDAAYVAWQTARAAIGSHIGAYFAETGLRADWDRFSELVTSLYTLSDTGNQAFKEEQVTKIREQLPLCKANWEALSQVHPREAGPDQQLEYQQAWDSVKSELLAVVDRLNHYILKTRAAL